MIKIQVWSIVIIIIIIIIITTITNTHKRTKQEII